LKEKSLAAHRAGLKTMIIPHKNQKDLIDIPRNVQRDIKFITVKTMAEVLPLALAPEKVPGAARASQRRGRALRQRETVRPPVEPTGSQPPAH
jgi:ATP-dependent Lon protease